MSSELRVAIITGSATGVGAATALEFARRGFAVLINYSRSESEAQQTAQACRAQGADTLCLQADVADDSACRSLAAAALDRWQRIDVLVNNAGITNFAGVDNWEVLDDELFQRIYAVNTVGSFQMVRACRDALKQTRGAIVNVSSTAGALGVGSSIPYIASKGALNAMTLHLARVLAPAVRVNAVCPGMITSRWFKDGIGEEAYARQLAGYEKAMPLARACSPEDVAEAIVWLATGASTVTGELLMLDSGMHLARR